MRIAYDTNNSNNLFSLDDFIKSLKENGFSIDIDDYIIAAQLNNLLSNSKLNEEQIKHSLSAIICRNEAEQIQFYQLFSENLKIRAKEKELKKKKEEEEEERKKKLWRIKTIFIVFDIFFILLIFLTLASIIKTKSYVAEESTFQSHGHHTTEEPFQASIFNDNQTKDKKWATKQTIYDYFFNPKKDTTGLKINWYLNDTIIKDKKSIIYNFKTLGKKKIITEFYTSDTNKKTYTNIITICEASPKIKFDDNSIYANKKTTITATHSNNKAVEWKIDQFDTITKDSILNYVFKKKGNYNISCKTLNQLCEHDELNTKSIHVVDQNQFLIEDTSLDKFVLKVDKSLTYLFFTILGIISSVLLCCLLLLFIPSLNKKFEALIQDINKKNNSKKAKEYFNNVDNPIVLGNKPPIDIPFYNKDRLIRGKESLRKLGLDLQKKVATEDTKLNILSTIKTSIRNYDLITPVYENKNSKRSYLILIDTTYAKSKQVKLFNFLVNQLKKSQVDIDVYYYFKDPIKVFKKEIDDSIDIKRLKDNFYQSVLIVFSDGYNFLDVNSPAIYIPIKKEYSYWSKRILITPTPSLDWSISEKILAQFFHIVPADSSGLLGIFQLLQKGDYNQKVIYTKDFNTYETKFIEFEEIEILEKYIKNETVFQWLCAIATYPKISWEIVLTIGTSIDESIVTYENLLKINRIQWIQSGNFPTRIRLELLKKLTLDNEEKARIAIIKILEEESTKDEESFSNNERIIQLIFNKFILFTYKPNEYPSYAKEEKEFLKLYNEGKFRDIPLKVYLQGYDPDKPNDKWKSTLGESKNQDVDNLQKYFNTKTNSQSIQTITKNIRVYLKTFTLFTSAILLCFLTLSTIEFFTNLNLNLMINRETITPTDWNVTLNAEDDCYKAFDPVKLIISNGETIIYSDSLKQQKGSIPLKNFNRIVNKYLNFQIVSNNNDTISNSLFIGKQNTLVNITGNCKIIKAVYLGKHYELYKDILQNQLLRTKHINTAEVPNSIIFSKDVDSNVIYRLCIELIKKKFPLKEIRRTDNFTKSQVENKNTKIQFSRSETNNTIITTKEELDIRFWKPSTTRPKIEIIYFPTSNSQEAMAFKDAVINSDFKYATINIDSENKTDVDFKGPQQGIYIFNNDLKKTAQALNAISSKAIKKNLRFIPGAKSNNKDYTIYVLFLKKITMRLDKTNDYQKVINYMNDRDLLPLFDINPDKKENIINNNANYFYYKNTNNKQMFGEFAGDLMNVLSLKRIAYKPGIKYDIEIGYDKQYDKCTVLTPYDLDNNQLDCKEKCISGSVSNYKYVLYLGNSGVEYTDDDFKVLNPILDKLQEAPGSTMIIKTYSNQKTDALSKQISERRGKNLAYVFNSNNIPQERIEIVSMGKTGYMNQTCFDRAEIEVIVANNQNLINVPSGGNYTEKSQFLYYGDYYDGKWSKRYFKNSQNELKFPEVGDEIITTHTLNIREQVNQYSENKNIKNQWVEGKNLGSLNIGIKVIVTKVITLAGGHFIWVEYKLSSQNKRQEVNSSENFSEQSQQLYDNNSSINSSENIKIDNALNQNYTLYIHYEENFSRQSSVLKTAFIEEKYIVKKEQNMGNLNFPSNVKYFYKKDKDRADQIAKKAEEVTKKKFKVQFMELTSPENQIEIWIGR